MLTTNNNISAIPSGLFSNSFYTNKYVHNNSNNSNYNNNNNNNNIANINITENTNNNNLSNDILFPNEDTLYETHSNLLNSNDTSIISNHLSSYKPDMNVQFELQNHFKNNHSYINNINNNNNSIINNTNKISKPFRNNSNSSNKRLSSTTNNINNNKLNRQPELSPDYYKPADPSTDLSNFTEEDVIVLKNLLSLAEIHKWKYISNKLSKIRSKKLNTEYCINKFHLMYNLPFNPKNNSLNSNYFLKMNDNHHNHNHNHNHNHTHLDHNISLDNNNTNTETEEKEETFEGMLGSSLPYIVSKDGWNLIDQ